jgi:hypothetical protein
MLGRRTRKIAAISVIAMFLACSGAVVLDDENTGESDAVVPVFIIVGYTLAQVSAAVAAGAAAGFAAGYFMHDMIDGGGASETVTRGYEAEAVADSIMDGMDYYTNALENYAQIWDLTDMHQIRQAELAASFSYDTGESFDPYTTLTAAGIYKNSGHMIFNATGQVNCHLDSLSERMDIWNGTDAYRDKMTFKWVYGGGSISSKDSFDGHLASAINVMSSSQDKAYLDGGELWVFGGPATITSESGTTIDLSQGYNDLGTISSFEPDVYEFQSGRQYAGCILSVNDAESAPVNAGMVMEAGTSVKLAVYNNGSVIVDGGRHNSLQISVIPDGAQTRTSSVIESLEYFEILLREVESTISEASSAASTVWNIFDRAGQASRYLTTLMVPIFYDNVELAGSQQEVMTTLAMEQLYQYYQQHGGRIKTGEYAYSGGSMSFFVRGDIISPGGDMLYEDVICTPYYYQSDQTLSNGTNTQTQNCTVAVWDAEGESLTGWDKRSGIADANLVSVRPGAQLYIREMMYEDEIVNTLTLDLKDIDYIEGNEMDPSPLTPDLGSDSNKWWYLMILVGVICLILGFAFRDELDWLPLLGIALIAIGVFMLVIGKSLIAGLV